MEIPMTTARESKLVSKEEILAAAAPFRFASWINEGRIFSWKDDGYDLDRVLRELSEKIMNAEPALEAEPAEYVSALRLTASEGAWLQCYWSHTWIRSPAYDAMTKDRWSVRRCQSEMVAMLRALIELDRLSMWKYEVTIISDIVHDFDYGELKFVDSEIFNELDRLPKGTKEGQLLRWGMFLALQIHKDMADGRTGVDLNPEGLYARLVKDLGADDPLQRPAREIDPEHLGWLQKNSVKSSDEPDS